MNKASFALDAEARGNYLGLGDLFRIDSANLGEMRRYQWHMQIGWLRIWFYYDTDPPLGLGAPWTSDSGCLYLGEFESAPPEELSSKTQNDEAAG